MKALVKDLRFALRQLRNAPGFAFTVVLTLALGIGATTAIFTLVYDVLLRPLPSPHEEQLVVMQEQVAEFRDIYPRLPMNANHFEMWQRNARTVDVPREACEPVAVALRDVMRIFQPHAFVVGA